VINETAAKTYFPGEDPIGRRIAVGGGFADGAEVVGIVGDQRFRALEVPAEPDVYIAYSQVVQPTGYLFLRTSSNPAALAGAIRQEVERLDPNLPVYDVQTMEQRFGTATARTRVTGMLLALFAVAAFVLALIGIYGVVGFTVAQRTREIGLRVALGAPRKHVAALTLRYSALLVAAGLALMSAIVAFAASAAPTLRAVRVDPLIALRSE
jgi:ABC-type lipoprotein release transport system permease subunit